MFSADAVFPVKLEIWESYRESRSIIRRVILQASFYVWTEILKTYYYFCQYIVYCHGKKFMRGQKISFDTGLILLLDFCAVSKSRRCTDQWGFLKGQLLNITWICNLSFEKALTVFVDALQKDSTWRRHLRNFSVQWFVYSSCKK